MSENADRLPVKSREKYLKNYNNFMKWKQDNGIDVDTISGSILLEYFEQLPKNLGPSTLWVIYSMLKTTLAVKHNVDVTKYTKLTAYLKNKSVGHKSKESRVFKADEIEKFINNAPDDEYLATKVALIFGINGGCRTKDLLKIRTSDVETHNEMYYINLPSPKQYVDRSFIIRGNYYNIVKKYESLRPENTETDRFFLNYQYGRCIRQPIGIHTLGRFPRNIAMYLKLPQPAAYNGHCFRKTSMVLCSITSKNMLKSKSFNPEVVSEDSDSNSRQNVQTFYVDPTDGMTLRSKIPCEDTPETESPTIELPIHSFSPSTETKTTNIHVQGKSISLTFNNCPNARVKLIFNN